MSRSTVTIGEQDIDFELGVDDYNSYLNAMAPNDKVAPAFNFLSRTVVEKDKETLKKLVLIDGKPNGILCTQIAGVLIEEFNTGVTVSLKKPKPSPKE